METKASISILIVMVLIIGTGIVMANENFLETKKLIDSGISCNNLTNEQLEEMGDYYMEQMHPGEAHEMMHKMMGGEDSETTKLMHINMAKGIYCGENVGMNGMMSGGMMNSGMMNTMGGGMMGNNYQAQEYNNASSYILSGFQIFFYIILTLVIVVLILIIILLINKTKQKRR